MASLLEMKQKIRNFLAKYDLYILPLLKFILAFLYFSWINDVLGYSQVFGNIFVQLILALLCAIFPINAMVVFGFALIVGHCYTLGWAVALLALLLIVLLLLLCLRFTGGANLAFVFAPLGFWVRLPAAVPLCCGLLSTPASAASSASGVFMYYFLRSVNTQSSVLLDDGTEITQKLKLILDGVLQDQEMWLTVAAFVIVVLLVYALRTQSMDYAWRFAIVLGIVAYIMILFAGALFLDVSISVAQLLISSAISLIFGFIVEFFAYGGDYSRVEHLQFEDDDYFYYVRAVPKSSVSVSHRKIKKINRDSRTEPREGVSSVTPEERRPKTPDTGYSFGEPPQAQQDPVDYEKQLEESLKEL